MPPFIPKRTRTELASPAAPGGRHAQIVKIAVPLLGNGLSPEAGRDGHGGGMMPKM
jgi:hypothetical protein